MDELLKRAKVKGQLVRMLNFKDSMPSTAELAWIEEKCQLLAEHRLTAASKPAQGKTTGAWFQQFLGRNAANGIRPIDFAAVEKKCKLALPPSYKKFMLAAGPMSFADVNGIKGFVAHVLPPSKLDFKNHRRGKTGGLDQEQSQIDDVVFASTDHGDCFVFDVSGAGNDPPVFWHDHEQNSLEPFAPNFMECIKRFAEKN